MKHSGPVLKCHANSIPHSAVASFPSLGPELRERRKENFSRAFAFLLPDTSPGGGHGVAVRVASRGGGNSQQRGINMYAKPNGEGFDRSRLVGAMVGAFGCVLGSTGYSIRRSLRFRGLRRYAICLTRMETRVAESARNALIPTRQLRGREGERGGGEKKRKKRRK